MGRLVTSDYGVHGVGVTVGSSMSWLDGYDPQTKTLSFSLQWKSDASTKDYLTQILLANNGRYWQAGKNSCMHMKVQGHLMQLRFIEIHQDFTKKKILDSFLTYLVCFKDHHCSNTCNGHPKAQLAGTWIKSVSIELSYVDLHHNYQRTDQNIPSSTTNVLHRYLSKWIKSRIG